MLTKPDEVGGINLNPEQLPIETRGEEIPFDMTPLEQINTTTFTGFAPVIHTITPLFNVPQLMGFADDGNNSPSDNNRIVFTADPVSIYSRRNPY
ncbi:MAG: hypothetical protein K8S27_01530 [Candidatus Omnitrophica bacterium]|nr:hypothetical protein [Candidatus Omnitrophota bacterium]